jgi:hypothetical protein
MSNSLDFNSNQLQFQQKLTQYKEIYANYTLALQSQGPNTKVKTGNDGSVSGDQYCAGSWAGGPFGKCISVLDTATNKIIPCSSIRGKTTPGSQVTITCANNKIKTGNDGSVSGDQYCAGDWAGGPFGKCILALDTATNKIIPCSTRRGPTTPGSQVTITCSVNTVLLNYLNQLQLLNDDLIKLSTQMTQYVKQNKPYYNTQKDLLDVTHKQLLTNYNNLLNERLSLTEIINKNDNIDEKNDNFSLLVNKYFYYNTIWIIAMLIILYVLFRILTK